MITANPIIPNARPADNEYDSLFKPNRHSGPGL